MNSKKDAVKKTIVAIETARKTEVADDLNPEFIFDGIDTSLLLKLASGELNADFLIRRAIADRGLDKAGRWVGFDASSVVWDVKDV